MKKRVQAGRSGCSQVSGVMYDRRPAARVKYNFKAYKMTCYDVILEIMAPSLEMVTSEGQLRLNGLETKLVRKG